MIIGPSESLYSPRFERLLVSWPAKSSRWSKSGFSWLPPRCYLYCMRSMGLRVLAASIGIGCGGCWERVLRGAWSLSIGKWRSTRAFKMSLAGRATIVAASFCIWAMTSCRTEQTKSTDQNAAISFVGWNSGSTRDAEKVKALLGESTARTGIRVNYIVGPESTDDLLALYRQWFERKSESPDVLTLDNVWKGILAEHLADLNPYLEREVRQIVPRAAQDDTVDGRLVAMPFNMQMGVLYYRQDLLRKYGFSHPPVTWEELVKMASRIQQGERAQRKKDFWGFVWQGAPYEGLTCDALEWQASYGGGNIIDNNGHVAVENPRTIKALKMAKSWIGKISPPSVLTFMEEDGRSIWEKGNAAFRRDWTWRTPYEKPLSSETAISLLPQDGAQATVLGGESLAISRYSKHPREAAELIRFLTSRDVQARLWQEELVLPVNRDLISDPQYIGAQPELERLEAAISTGGIVRPSVISGKRYPEVSRAYYTAVHSALEGQISVERAVSKLQTDLVNITGLPPVRPHSRGNTSVAK